MPSPDRVISAARTVRVLVDVTGIHKTFDYLIEPADRDRVTVGTEVRARLGARNVRGWIVALDVQAPEGVRLQPVRKVRGVGPAIELIELAEWAAWRWAGHPAQLMRIASAPTVVSRLPGEAPPRRRAALPAGGEFSELVDEALRVDVGDERPCVVRLPPATDRLPFITEVLERCVGAHRGASAIVACPGLRAAARLSASLQDAGFAVADVSAEGPAGVRTSGWVHAAAGGSVVVGTRNVAWAPAPRLSVVIVVDEHDEAYQSTRMPTWNARDVLAERARRSGVPLVQLSSTPSLEAQAWSRLVATSREASRQGWPHVEVIDRRDEDPRTASSLFSDRLGARLDRSGRTVCVLNRTGRVRLLACRACDALARCEVCGAAVHAPADAELVCPRCAAGRPRICAECGSAALKNLRIGVNRAREELEALVAEPVAEVTADGRDDVGDPQEARVVIGTEAALHRVGRIDTVVFLDFDQELTAPRFRAAEQAMVLLARAARLVGVRDRHHRVIVQTRLASHPVLTAAVDGDPAPLLQTEASLRRELGFPPYSAMALVSGAGGATFVSRIPEGSVEVLSGGDGSWLVRAPDHETLCDALAATPRPEERLRIEVDPSRA